MNRIKFSIIILITLAIFMVGIADYSISYGLNYQNNGNSSLNSLQASNKQVLGSTDYGNVIKSGPYGSPNGNQKIAFIVGVPVRNRFP